MYTYTALRSAEPLVAFNYRSDSIGRRVTARFCANRFALFSESIASRSLRSNPRLVNSPSFLPRLFLPRASLRIEPHLSTDFSTRRLSVFGREFLERLLHSVEQFGSLTNRMFCGEYCLLERLLFNGVTYSRNSRSVIRRRFFFSSLR